MEDDFKLKENKDIPIANSQKYYMCCEDGCDLRFTTYLNFKKHRKYQHLLKNKCFTCEIPGCEKSYKQNHHLTRHIKQAHSSLDDQKEPIKCTFQDCLKEFTSKHTLYKHVKRFHENKTFKCPSCEKIFKKHHHLKSHEYEHTKIKPFNCNFEGCGRSFLFPSQMRRHLKTHQGYNCTECSESFPKWSALVHHRKVNHKKATATFECQECHKHFSSVASLNRHSLTHCLEREAFHCPHDACHRFYYSMKNLQHHIRVFHDNIRIPCSHEGCELTFVNKSKMKAHLKMHEPSYILATLQKKKTAAKESRKEQPVKRKKSERKKVPMSNDSPVDTSKMLQEKPDLAPVLSQDNSSCLEIPPFIFLKTDLPQKVR